MGSGKHIIEIRIITHVPTTPRVEVALLFDDGTCSAHLTDFASYEHAEAFRKGLREGFGLAATEYTCAEPPENVTAHLNR